MSAQQSKVLVAADNGRGMTIIHLTDARMYRSQKYAWLDRDWYITYPEGDSSLSDNRQGCWVPVLYTETGVHVIDTEIEVVAEQTDLEVALYISRKWDHDDTEQLEELVDEYLSDWHDEEQVRRLLRDIRLLDGLSPTPFDNPIAPVVARVTEGDARRALEKDTAAYQVLQLCAVWRQHHLPPEVHRSDAPRIARILQRDLERAGCVTDDAVYDALVD